MRMGFISLGHTMGRRTVFLGLRHFHGLGVLTACDDAEAATE